MHACRNIRKWWAFSPVPLFLQHSSTVCRSSPSKLQWLEQAALQCNGSTAGMSSCIIDRADSMHLHQQNPLLTLASSDSCTSSVPLQEQGTNSSYTGSDSDAATADDRSVERSVMLQHQQFSVPSNFTVPPSTSVPVHQLVAVFSSMLGAPQLSKNARTASMEAKWRLLQLLLLHHVGDSAAFEEKLQELLHKVLLQDSARKLHKVMRNAKVPSVNKQIAQQRFQQLWDECHINIVHWVSRSCGSSNFSILQPAMSCLAGSIDASVLGAAGCAQGSAGKLSTATSGRLMEVAAVQVVREALPLGWTLLTSLHVMGVDGQLLVQPQRGCKYEVDMLVLDETGLAVAVIEVKLAAANPLMALVNDVSSLLRLVDCSAGKTLTCLTKDPAAATAAVADAASNSTPTPSTGAVATVAAMSVGMELQRKTAAIAARAPFGEGPGWQVVHVRMHQQPLPVYVLGKGLGTANVARGLSSLVSSSALKLLAKSPTDLAAALQQGQQIPQQQQQQQEPAHAACSDTDDWQFSNNLPGLCSSSSSSADFSSGLDADSISRSSSIGLSDDCHGDAGNLCWHTDMEPVHTDAQWQNAACLAPGSSKERQGDSIGQVRGKIRTGLHLNEEQQSGITQRILDKLTLLQERCMIYSLCRPQP